MIDILVPSLNRSHRLEALIDNLHVTTNGEHTLFFAISDDESARILTDRGENFVMDSGEPPESTFASRINRLYTLTDGDYIYPVGDDDEHLPDWDTHMLACMTDGIEVVVSKCNHMELMTRRYIQALSGCVDIPTVVFAPYHHNFTEVEFIATAKHRGVAAWCPVSTVIHHRWQGNDDCCVGDVEKDETYAVGDSGWEHDLAMFNDRESRLFPNSRYW